MSREKIKGLIAAPLTPMTDDGEVNLEPIEAYAALLARNGVAGVFICGTTGEGVSLTCAERMDVARRWVDVAGEGFRVIVHVGQGGLGDARVLAAHARQIGAWGIGAMGPCFFRPKTVEDLAAYCGAIASAAADLPFYYYHIPSMTGVVFPMVDFLAAAAPSVPNLAGIKYTWEDLMDFELCRMVDGGRYDILFGRDELLICALALGARGAIGSTYNFAAPLYRELIEAYDQCDFDRARRLQRISMQTVKLLKESGGSFNAAAKAVMKMRGVDCGPVRMPLRTLSASLYKKLETDLEAIGLFEYCPKAS